MLSLFVVVHAAEVTQTVLHRHVHLHVISGDLVSERLKNRKHYNSFHPTLGFFLHLDDVIELVEQHGANTLGTLVRALVPSPAHAWHVS